MLISFGYLPIHELTVLGKELTRKFYNTFDFYSYYHGCSEGGRDGFTQVQKYGKDFDGAAIGAPAIRYPFHLVQKLFAKLVEISVGYFPPACEMDRITLDAIAACDELDGRKDGVVSRTELCRISHFANASIGNFYNCSAMESEKADPLSGQPPASGIVTAQAAAIAQQIWDGIFDSKGRRIYLSYTPTAAFDTARAYYNSASKLYTSSFDAGQAARFVNRLLGFNHTLELPLVGVTNNDLRAWMLQGMRMYESTLMSNWPDLEDMKKSGGKIIHVHGESDQNIPAYSSAVYHDSVRKIMHPKLNLMDGYQKLHEWYRFFLVPGAAHCVPDSNQPNCAFPQDVLQSLINWVEQGVNPELLDAKVLLGNTTDKNQKLCSFPLRPLWNNTNQIECVFDEDSYESWVPEFDSIPVPLY